jgi:hypothetical protein
MNRKIEAERRHHAWLDRLAAACSERTGTHLGCAYCAYLAWYYDPKRIYAS